MILHKQSHAWLLLLSMVIFHLIHVIVCISHFLLLSSLPFVWVYCVLFIPLPVDKHGAVSTLGLLQISCYEYSCISLCTGQMPLFLLGKDSGVKRLHPVVAVCFELFKKLSNCFPK